MLSLLLFCLPSADVTIVGDVKEVNGCTIIVQRVASEVRAVWPPGCGDQPEHLLLLSCHAIISILGGLQAKAVLLVQSLLPPYYVVLLLSAHSLLLQAVGFLSYSKIIGSQQTEGV